MLALDEFHRRRKSGASGIQEFVFGFDSRMVAFQNRARASLGECWHSMIAVGHRLGNAGIRGSMSDIRSRMLAFKSDVERQLSNAGIQRRCGALALASCITRM
jgi:hypothetical protein